LEVSDYALRLMKVYPTSSFHATSPYDKEKRKMRGSFNKEVVEGCLKDRDVNYIFTPFSYFLVGHIPYCWVCVILFPQLVVRCVGHRVWGSPK